MHLIVSKHKFFPLTHVRRYGYTCVTNGRKFASPQTFNTTQLPLTIPVMIFNRQNVTISTNPAMYIYKLLHEFEVC